MSLSQNIKRLRIENNLTQEQLASRLGISPQAVSKWETSDTYPDGAILVPLANALGVSLDELFDNQITSMKDISSRIMNILLKTEKKEQFNVARDITWQIERGIFNSYMKIDDEYDPDEIKNNKQASHILTDYGFTMISNGKEPFFALFPEPEEGFGSFLKDMVTIKSIFTALSSDNTMKAIINLYGKNNDYIFESTVLADECGISHDEISVVMENLLLLRFVYKMDLEINGESRIIYKAAPNHRIISLLIIAQDILYKGSYCLQAHERNKPYIL